MVRNANPQCFIDSFGYSAFNMQPVVVGKALKTSDAGFPVPRSESIGIEVVDPVSNAQSANKGLKTDAARYDENRSVLAELLKFSSQPAQELVHPLGSPIMIQQSFEEYWQLVNDQEHSLLLVRAVS